MIRVEIKWRSTDTFERDTTNIHVLQEANEKAASYQARVIELAEAMSAELAFVKEVVVYKDGQVIYSC